MRVLEWVAVSFLGHLPNPGIKPVSLLLTADSLPTEPSGKSIYASVCMYVCVCLCVLCVCECICTCLYERDIGGIYKHEIFNIFKIMDSERCIILRKFFHTLRLLK